MEKTTIVLGVIGADVHAVGNKIIDFAFTNAGYNIINLGVMVSQEEFIEAALESDARAILVSSLYGHGEIDCRGLRAKCDEAGLRNVRIYVGGNLVIGKADPEMVISTFKNMGFDRVYPSSVPIETAIREISEDLGHSVITSN
ncbi:MAG: methylaspartate mutase subunit S [Defluviitaleaceae bacterium]|nr:methylaspartate mutase subunit S [Defluviitaleaceae bacterium]